MPNHPLPNRAAAVVEPQRPVQGIVSAAVLTRFIYALTEWAASIEDAVETPSPESNAIGVVRWDNAAQGTSAAAELKHLAAEHNYFLVEVVGFDVDSRAAGLLLSQHIRDAEADAVLTPSLEHVGELKWAITLVCDLVTHEQVYPCGHQWPAPLSIVGGDQ
ncbi:hypothetical protein [Nocardia sp. NPDC050412]|uniref:hypothetical protein n=1 Tax=Nocardia sp. NPDC050412 TaxID=3364320 RepID=UPI0037BDA805